MSGPLTGRKVRAPEVVAVGVLTLLLAGCGSSPSANGTSPTTASPSATHASPITTVTPSPTRTSAPTTSAPTPATVTTVVITVRGCPKGCRIFAEQDGSTSHPLARPWQISALVRDGQVTLNVPVARTRGLHFAVGCSGDVCNSSNAAPVVVLRYRGVAVGAVVTDAVARTRTEASACWAGTTSAAEAFTLDVSVFPDRILTRQAHSIRAWMSPQVEVVPGTWTATYRGGIGTQDVVLC